jgi:hypothetical protein
MSRPWLPGLPVFAGLVLLPGCSNAPVAGTLDCIFPSRLRPSPVIPDRERDRDLEPIRPIDRVPERPDDPRAPLDPPRPIRDGLRSGDPRLGDPIGRDTTPRTRRTEPEPRDGDDDRRLPLLPPSGGGGGLSEPLPPPPGVR